MTVKNLSCVKINSVNPLCLIIDKINGYIEESSGNRYLTLVPINECNEILKKYEEMWIKTRYLITSITNNSYDSDEKYMKINFNSDDDLLLNKVLELRNMVIVVTSVLHEGKKWLQKMITEFIFCM